MAISKQEVIDFGKTVVMDTSGFELVEYVMLGTACFSGEHEIQELEAEKNEWKYEYINPYVESLPILTEKNIKSMKIDYLLKEQTMKEDYFTTDSIEAKPFTIINKDEKVYHVWAQVVVDKKIKKPYLEYQYQDEDFSIDFTSREYNAVLYTNKEL